MKKVLNDSWSELEAQPAGFIPNNNDFICLFSDYGGRESDTNYLLSWQDFKNLVAGSIPTTNTAGVLTGDGSILNPIRLINGSNVNDILQWNGVNWTVGTITIPVDADWYLVGGTSFPTAITDSIYHTGAVTIGTNTPVIGKNLTVNGAVQIVNSNGFTDFNTLGNGFVTVGDSTGTGHGGSVSINNTGAIAFTTNNTTRGTINTTGSWAIGTSGFLQLFNVTGTGIALTNQAPVRFYDASNNSFIGLVSPNLGDNTIYTLPANAPTTNNSLLVSTTGGILSWITPSTLGFNNGEGITYNSINARYDIGGGIPVTGNRSVIVTSGAHSLNFAQATGIGGTSQVGVNSGSVVMSGTGDGTYNTRFYIDTNGRGQLQSSKAGTEVRVQFDGNSNNGIEIFSDKLGFQGLVYNQDWSTNFINESLVSKRYVDGLFTLNNLQQVTTVGNNTTNNIIFNNSQARFSNGFSSAILKANVSNENLDIGSNTNSFYASLNKQLLTDNRTFTFPNKSGIFALTNDIPIFLDETSTIADFQTGNTYYYIGEAPITYNYDLEPYPAPTPVSGYNFINLSVHNVIFNSAFGNITYVLTPNQRLRDIQIVDNGQWELSPVEYVDNIYDLQQVTNKGAETSNAIVVKNNPDTYRTRYSIIGQEIQKDDLGYRVLNSHFAIRKSTTSNSKTWEIQYPDLTANANSSSFVVDFRPNVSGTVAYLSDLTAISNPTLQDVTDNGNTTTNSIIVDEGLGTGTITINPVTNNILVDDLLGNVSEITPTGFFVTDGTNNMSVSTNQITFNTSVLAIRNALSGTVALLSDINVGFYTDTSFFPVTGTEDIIYVSKTTNELYVWSNINVAYELLSVGTLQQVTAVGNSTINDIQLNGSQLRFSNFFANAILRCNPSNENLDIGSNSNAFFASLNKQLLTQNRTFSFPDNSGTFALISDIPSTVNNILQDGNSFSTNMVIGTNDAFNLSFETNGVIKGTFDTTGGLQLFNLDTDRYALAISNTVDDNNYTKFTGSTVEYLLGFQANRFLIKNNTTNADLLSYAHATNALTLGNTTIAQNVINLLNSNAGYTNSAIGINSTRKFYYTDGSTVRLFIRTTNQIATDTVNYETLVTNDNDIPNKKYVDDKIDIEPYTITGVNYVLTTANRYLECTSALIVTLITAVSNTGRKFSIINSSNNTVIINSVLSETIGNTVGSPTTINLLSGEVLDIISNGTNWRII